MGWKGGWISKGKVGGRQWVDTKFLVSYLDWKSSNCKLVDNIELIIPLGGLSLLALPLGFVIMSDRNVRKYICLNLIFGRFDWYKNEWIGVHLWYWS